MFWNISDPHCQAVLADVFTVSSALSLLGSTVIIFFYFYYFDRKVVSDPALHMVFFLSFADVCASILFLVASRYNDVLLRMVTPDMVFNYSSPEALHSPCAKVQSYDLHGNSVHFLSEYNITCVPNLACLIEANVNQFFVCSSVTWILAIATQLFRAVYLEKPGKLYPYHIFCWGFPILSCIIVTASGKFGPNSDTCWIVDGDILFHVLFLYMFIIGGMVYIIIVYVLVWWKIAKSRSSVDKLTGRKMGSGKIVRRFVGYPLMFFVTWIGGCYVDLNIRLNLACGVLIWKTVTFPLQGFLNALVYGLSEKVYRRFYDDCMSKWRKRKVGSAAWSQTNTERAQRKRSSGSGGKLDGGRADSLASSGQLSVTSKSSPLPGSKSQKREMRQSLLEEYESQTQNV